MKVDMKMSMLEMEYQLLSDALKKIPNDSRLLNARLHVLMRVCQMRLIKCSWNQEKNY